MKKNVQIPEELFCRLCSYFLLDHREPLQEDLIKIGLEDKLDAVQRRKEYAESHKKEKNTRA